MNERRKKVDEEEKKRQRDPKGPVNGVLPDVNIDGSSRILWSTAA